MAPKIQLFNEGFVLRPVMAGGLFTKETLAGLNKCMQMIGDKRFAIVEDIDKKKEPRFSDNGFKIPQLKFSYPFGIAWEDYMIHKVGGILEGISLELLLAARNYYVFGDSGEWGKYTANDADQGLGVAIFGFKPKYLDLFRTYFPVPEEERGALEAPLPEHYRKRIIW